MKWFSILTQHKGAKNEVEEVSNTPPLFSRRWSATQQDIETRKLGLAKFFLNVMPYLVGTKQFETALKMKGRWVKQIRSDQDASTIPWFRYFKRFAEEIGKITKKIKVYRQKSILLWKEWKLSEKSRQKWRIFLLLVLKDLKDTAGSVDLFWNNERNNLVEKL